MANDSIGEEVEKLVAQLPEGGVLLLENVRFYKAHLNSEKLRQPWHKRLQTVFRCYTFRTSLKTA